MIQTPTTFIIGAGASCAYGLPAAAGLHEKAKALSPAATAYQLLLETREATAVQLNDFLDDLRAHPAPSIDAFLESRQDDQQTMRIGRLVIAVLMAQAIWNARTQQPRGDDWLGYVIERMRRGAPTSHHFANGNSRLRFVTFNFDTIIEARLFKAVSAIYRNPPDVVIARVLASFPVIHVHGMLPPLPSRSFEEDHFGACAPEWVEWLVKAASGIRVVMDDIEEETVAAARAAIAQAEVLCFLGFAYATENMSRLDLPGQLVGRSPNVYGSAYGLVDGEQAWVKGRLPIINLGSHTANCFDVLRIFHVFRD